ncbi:esterase-like activity of phytase family protein [Cupriavidus sp. 30B13]|uniref:esterase-like activity of phytase family protein n=1 Tax=Cupriavidus sp. 30B13 TaxID=3384241 RepID=UPI003CF21F48
MPARKRLVLDLDRLALPRLDNLEGMAWGPKTGRGCATLAMVSDDNFSPRQVTQVLAFDVLPDSGICPP